MIAQYESVEEIIDEFFEGIRDDIRKKAEDGRKKYTTYLMINPSLTKPKVYENLKLQKHVSMIGKLRTSSHNLHIEMGRRTGKVRERRVCLCENGVEDEEHFLRRCQLYYDVRKDHNIANQTVEEILNDATKVRYISDLMERRKQLTSS